MTHSHSTRPQIRFEGEWTPDQRTRVSEAIDDFEATRSGTGLFDHIPTWICIATDVGPSTVYQAHRPALDGVPTAESPDDLAQTVRDAA